VWELIKIHQRPFNNHRVAAVPYAMLIRDHIVSVAKPEVLKFCVVIHLSADTATVAWIYVWAQFHMCPKLLLLPNTSYEFSKQRSTCKAQMFKWLTLPFCLSSGNETYYSGQGRVILKPQGNVPNALFVIEEATMEDRGLYSCSATNANNFTDSATVYVRVKGKKCSMPEAFYLILYVVLS
jgi:hypothetical protein